LSFEIVVKL